MSYVAEISINFKKSLKIYEIHDMVELVSGIRR